MAGELWNKLHIPFPSAVSSVRIHFNSRTDVNIKTLLVENENVLKLIRSEILQTEIRLLYELLYILNNSYRGIKTLKALKQVEQCINRLKNMKLNEALEGLTELCPNRVQRGLSIKTGECDVPSQPMLEWLCLKVLGASQLMSCTLNRCSRAFILSKQHVKWDEFVILNMVILSMLSRLWVIFRGILVSLSTLYQQLLEFLRKVAHAQPMPFLRDFSLPADVVLFLGPADASLLTAHLKRISRAKDRKEEHKKKKSSVKVKNQRQARKIKEDLGVAVERGIVNDHDIKPFIKVFRNFTEGKSFPRRSYKAGKTQKFKKQVREAATFTDMATHLDKMILWCKSRRMEREKRLLTFLRLKCHKMKCLEAAGYNVQRKLLSFRQEACWASSPRGSAPKTCRATASVRRNARLCTRLQSLKSRKSSVGKSGAKNKCLKGHRRKSRSRLSVAGLPENSHRSRTTTDSHDDIDDIFASAGL